MKVENFVKTIQNVKEKNKLDLSAWEDLSIGLMNLVSLEEHAYFSYIKTRDEKFLAILESVREMRKELLKLIVTDDDGSEKWCMSKHFLASSMRLFEVGNRMLHEDKRDEADKFYRDSAELYAMFWKLNAGAIKNKKDMKIEIKDEEKKGIFNSIKKLLECCKE
ncbi:hypothetical protein HY450_01860 [Candidatus Pacearchaeota archaeon]|nr:hypothetical protein [Candidatus Pacearchaeota archaeon]